MVDGLFFFQALSLVTEVGAISLVSREKEKLEPVVREKENTNPWLARSLQKSKHLVAKGDSSPVFPYIDQYTRLPYIALYCPI